ncbi:MAG: tRNA dimethylallyltransferase, partial [Bacteroidota bacterium]
LRQLDPAYFQQVDLNNPQRLIRALEVCRSSGKPFSSFQKSRQVERPFTPVYILLQLDRAVLYEKINRRVDEMMRAGLLEEARQLFPFRQLNALQTVGYQELFEYLEGNMSLERAVELIKQNTRRYAKRQETWFRKDAHWKVFSPENADAIIQFAAGQMGSQCVKSD